MKSRTMTNCPGCGSIQKLGVTCPLCTCPVTREQQEREAFMKDLSKSMRDNPQGNEDLLMAINNLDK